MRVDDDDDDDDFHDFSTPSYDPSRTTHLSGQNNSGFEQFGLTDFAEFGSAEPFDAAFADFSGMGSGDATFNDTAFDSKVDMFADFPPSSAPNTDAWGTPGKMQ
jgi:hypothetical protein